MGACLSRRRSRKEPNYGIKKPSYGPKVMKKIQPALPLPTAECVSTHHNDLATQHYGVDIVAGLSTRNMDHVILDILVYLYPDSLSRVRRVSRGWREAGDRVLATQVARRRLAERRLHGWKHGVERKQVVPVKAEISRTPRVHLATQVVACGGRDGCANVYKLGTGTSVMSVRHCEGDSGKAVTCCDIGDSFLATGTVQGLKLGPTVTTCPNTGDGRVRLWDRVDGSLAAECYVAAQVRHVKLWGEGGECLVVALGVDGDYYILSVMRLRGKQLEGVARYETTFLLQDIDCDAGSLVVGYTGGDGGKGGVFMWDRAEFVGDVQAGGSELEAHRMDWCSVTVKRVSLSSPWLATAGDEEGICVWSISTEDKVVTCFKGRSFTEVRLGPRMLAAVEEGGKKLVVADWGKMWHGEEEEEGGPWQREIVPGGRAGKIGGVAMTDTGIMYGESSGSEPSIEALLISGHGMVGVWVINTMEEDENYVIKMINFTAKEFRPLDYRAMFHK